MLWRHYFVESQVSSEVQEWLPSLRQRTWYHYHRSSFNDWAKTPEYLIERARWLVGLGQVMNGTRTPAVLKTPERRWFLPRTRGEGVSCDTLCGRPDKRLCLTTFRLTGRSQKLTHPLLSDGLLENYCLPQAVNLKRNNLFSPARLGAVCFYSFRLLFVYLGLGWNTDAPLWTSESAISGCIRILTIWVIL